MSVIVKKQILNLLRSPTQRVMGLTFAGMGLGLLVDVLIAGRLGLGNTADVLIIGLTLPLFIDNIGREVVKFSLVPIMIEKEKSSSFQEYNHFVSGLINFGIAVGLGTTVLSELLSPVVIGGLAPGFSASDTEESIVVLRICSPLILFSIAVSLLSVVHNSKKRFSIVALRNGFAPVVVLMTFGMFWSHTNLSRFIAGSFVVGYFGYCLLLFGVASRKGYHHRWNAWLSKEELLYLWRMVVYPLGGYLGIQLTRVAERMLASMTGAGGVAAYYFAFRITSALQTLIGASIATTSLPRLTERALAKDRKQFLHIIKRNVVRSFFVSIPVILMLLVFSPPILMWVYGWGNASRSSVSQISDLLFWLLVGLSFYCVVPILHSALYSVKEYGSVLANMLASSSVNILLAIWFSSKLGIEGIALAVPVASLFSVGLLTQFVRMTSRRF